MMPGSMRSINEAKASVFGRGCRKSQSKIAMPKWELLPPRIRLLHLLPKRGSRTRNEPHRATLRQRRFH